MKHTVMDQITDKEFEQIVKNSYSYREVAEKCGYCCISGASSNIVKKRIQKLNLDVSHFKKSLHVYRPDDEIFVEDSKVGQTVLRKRFLALNVVEYKCSICGQEPFWNGKPLSLTLDHINGKNHDNRFDNLRWVCPNCDRQLPTFGRRNAIHEAKYNYCVDCGIVITFNATRCKKCADKVKAEKQKNINKPNREELKKLIREKNFLTLGKEFNVSDNTIRNWCESYNLPKKTREIRLIKDQDWEFL